MSLQRYKRYLILYGILLGIFIPFFLSMAFMYNWAGSSAYYNISTQNIFFDIIILFLVIPVFGILGILIGGYVLTPLLLLIHKKTIGRKYDYGIENIQRPDKFKGAAIKAFFPALLAVSIGMLIGEISFFQDLVFSEFFFQTLGQQINPSAMLILGLIPVLAGIGIFVFSSFYFLIDAGLVYSNQNSKKVKNKTKSYEVRAVGGWFTPFLKGFTGITALIQIYFFMASFITDVGFQDPFSLALNTVFWFLMPFLIASFMVPSMIFLDITFERRQKYIRRIAEKLGIRTPAKEIFDKSLK